MGTLLALPAVGSRLALDDYVLALGARGTPAIEGLPRARFDLFTFTSGAPAANQRLIEQGVMLPWWSDERLKVSFFRPLSSLSHRLDYALWPTSPKLMYLHSLAWLALTLHLVARCYRRLESSPALAGACALLYAIDDARGPVVAWLSNRNALIATALGVSTLLAHDRWRRQGRALWGGVGAACLLLALLAGEFAVATFAYLFAHASFLDRGSPLARAKRLLPYAVVFAGWLLLYFWSGAGVNGSATYLSPFSDPGAFLRALPGRATTLFGAALGPGSADLSLFGPPEHARLWLGVALLVFGVLAVTLRTEIRRDDAAKFWLAGMLLAVLPIAASPPSDRLLLFVGLGGSALIARVVRPLWDSARRSATARGPLGVALGFGAIHVALAPLLLPLRAAQMQLLDRTMTEATSILDDVPELERRTVVIVSAPLDLLASYIQVQRAWSGAPRAERFYWLTSAGSPALVRRDGPKALIVERDGGFFSTPLELHYRREPRSLGVGSAVALSGMSATVRSVTGDGRARAVSFQFAEELESASYVFLVWEGNHYRRLDPARLAQPLRLPAEDFGRILTHTALGGAT